MTEPQSIRLFVAVAVPEAVKDSLCDLQLELRGALGKASVRWTPREQMHFTLRFLGNVRIQKLESLKAALADACRRSPVLQAEACSLGVFPPKRAPKVIWVGVQDRHNQLGRLQKEIETATALFGEKPEARDFSAHLTLGRIKEIRRGDERPLREFIVNRTGVMCGQWTVNEIELVQSQLGPSGAKHSVLLQCPLRSEPS